MKKRTILPVLLLVLGLALAAAGIVFRTAALDPGTEITPESVGSLAVGQRVSMYVDTREISRISDDTAVFTQQDIRVVVRDYSSTAGRLGVMDEKGRDQLLRGEMTSAPADGKAEMRLLPPDRRYMLFFFGAAAALFIALLALAGALLRRRLSRGKTALVIIALLAVCAGLAAWRAAPAARSVRSVRQIGDGLYTMNYTADYRLDAYLGAGVRNVGELDGWFMDNLTYGVSTESAAPPMACSSFACSDNEGSRLFGRNYDRAPTDALIVCTAPRDGYASVGIADLGHLNIGRDGQLDIDSPRAKAALLAAPYCVCDGMNEKGLGVSLLELDGHHVMYDTDAGELLIYTSLRAVLDRCASVDEAVAFLEGFDMCSPRGNTYHMFITDRSGRSVTVEWLDGSTYVVEDSAVTNFALHGSDGSEDYDRRYARMHEALDSGSIRSRSDAMALLSDVSQSMGHTCWSAVYDLDEYSVTVCVDRDYDNEHIFLPAHK